MKFGPSFNLSTRPWFGLVAILVLFLSLPTQAEELSAEEITVMEIPQPNESGVAIEAPGYFGDFDYSRYVTDYFFKGEYSSAWVGRYLDAEPAQRRARYFQRLGLTSFVLKKKFEEQRFLLPNEEVGDFYLVMVGLFGLPQSAEVLGQRLKAEGEISGYQVVPVDAPEELEITEVQNRAIDTRALETSRKAREEAARSISPDSPLVTGEAFKKQVYGRYVRSFRDLGRAEAEAERLTAGGWPASIKIDDGPTMWYRVYLIPTDDYWDWQADNATLEAASRLRAVQPGIVILADMSSLRGNIGTVAPTIDRDDASACAGFSEAGRLGTALSRTIVDIPGTSYVATLVSVNPPPAGSFFTTAPALSRLVYGPTIFNRQNMEKSILRLQADAREASLAQGLLGVYSELSTIPGRKILVVFSEFMGGEEEEQDQEQEQEIRAALGKLTGSLSDLDIVFVYGDTGAAGYELATSLGQEFGSGQGAWDGCLLLNNNGYFEEYIKDIFR